MKCPFCHEGDFAVIDSRSQDGEFPIRRRRSCDRCRRRVWTTEHVEENPLKVIKKTDHRREPFDADKLRHGIELACYKRPIGPDKIEALVRQIENDVYSNHFAEVSSSVIGDLVIDGLKQLDQVAYVRFASVYRSFEDVSDFVDEVQPMLPPGKRVKGRPPDTPPRKHTAG